MATTAVSSPGRRTARVRPSGENCTQAIGSRYAGNVPSSRWPTRHPRGRRPRRDRPRRSAGSRANKRSPHGARCAPATSRSDGRYRSRTGGPHRRARRWRSSCRRVPRRSPSPGLGQLGREAVAPVMASQRADARVAGRRGGIGRRARKPGPRALAGHRPGRRHGEKMGRRGLPEPHRAVKAPRGHLAGVAGRTPAPRRRRGCP